MSAFFRYVPSWTGLRRLGRNRVLRSSYVFFVIVPILARIRQALEASEFASLRIFASHVLVLPFSWEMFFFASLFVSAGGFLYEVACPGVIKEFGTRRTFHEGDESAKFLLATLAELLSRGGDDSPRWWAKVVRVLKSGVLEMVANRTEMQGMLNDESKAGTASRLETILENADIPQERLPELASLVWDLAEHSVPSVRLICTICYLVGGCFIAIVIAQNIRAVIDAM